MSSWFNLLQQAEPRHHVVQLYGRSGGHLVHGLAAYIAEGLRRQQGVLVVATGDHAEAIRHQLADDGVPTAAAVEQGTLRFLDAQTLLQQLLGNDGPDWATFQDVVGGVLSDLRARCSGAHIRVFGEMVGLFWESGRRREAESLEDCWNRLQETESFSLFCAYPVDIFADDIEAGDLGRLFGAHTHTCAGNGTLFSTSRQRRVS